MAYSHKIRAALEAAPKTLGTKLGKWALILDFPVAKVSIVTGATRQTVYNWFSGQEVSSAYSERVQQLLDILATSSTADEAWEKACSHFNLIP